MKKMLSLQFSRSVVSDSLWPLSITNSWSLLKLMSIESVMPSNHLFFCRPLLLPSIFPSLRFLQWVSSSHQLGKVLELQHQSFHEYSGLISFRVVYGKIHRASLLKPHPFGFLWRLYYICVIDWITGQWWSTSSLSPLPGLEGWDWNLMLTKIDWVPALQSLDWFPWQPDLVGDPGAFQKSPH